MADLNIIEFSNEKTNKNRIYSSREVASLKRNLLISKVLVVFLLIGGVYSFKTVCEEKEANSNYTEFLEEENNKLMTEYDLLQMHYDILEMRYDMLEQSADESSALIESLEGELYSTKLQLEKAEDYINSSITAPITKQYNRYTDLGVTEVMSVDRMNRIIDYWLNLNDGSDSPFKDHGDYFIEASKESGLDPIFIFAIAAHESNFGRSRIARNKKNFMGIGAVDVTPYSSALVLGDSTEAGLIQNAKWVADKYYNQGQTTLHSMIYGKKQYSTSTESWIRDIASIMSMSKDIK